VYLVLDEIGTLGRCYRETDEDAADKGTLVRNLLTGQYSNPVQVVAFNIAEGWCRDASREVAQEVVELARLEFERLPTETQKFVERHLGDVPAWPVY
jgi:hypothetical protein